MDGGFVRTKVNGYACRHDGNWVVETRLEDCPFAGVEIWRFSSGYSTGTPLRVLYDFQIAR